MAASLWFAARVTGGKVTARIANPEGICDFRRKAPGGPSRERGQRRVSRCAAGSGAGPKTGDPAEGEGFERTL